MRPRIPAFKTMFLNALFSLMILQSDYAVGEVQVAAKHLLIFRPGLDALWGSYIFALQNDSATAAAYKGQIMLPQETVDFQPQEGLMPDELTFADERLTLEKKVESGVQVVGIGFKVEAKLGQAVVTFTTATPIESLSVLVPKHGVQLTVSSEVLAPTASEASPDPEYIALFSRAPLAAGQTFKLVVSGIPEGRGRLWAIGATVGAVLLLGGGFFAWRTRPRLQENAEQAFIIG